MEITVVGGFELVPSVNHYHAVRRGCGQAASRYGNLLVLYGFFRDRYIGQIRVAKQSSEFHGSWIQIVNVEPLLLSRTIADNQSAQIGPPDADVRTEHVNIVIIDSSLQISLLVIKLSSDRKSFFLEICCQKNLPLVINDGPATLRLYVRCFGTEEKKNRLWRERL